jgi:large subunit ribosomal protein L22
MEVTSTTRNVRISPKKAREVAREIQGLPVSSALDILNFTPRKAAHLISKTLKTAIADAETVNELDADSLVVKEAVVGPGPTYRRYRPRARGSAGPIRKRTSHIKITLSPPPEEDTGADSEEN